MALVLNGTTGASMVQDDSVNPVTDIASGIPCFSAYQNVVQSLSAGVTTKITFNITSFDTTNAFDEVNNRFQPLVAGYYMINTNIRVDSSCSLGVYIYKNGALKTALATISVGAGGRVSSGDILYMNGLSDYIEIFANSSVSNGFAAVEAANAFQAHLIVGA